MANPVINSIVVGYPGGQSSLHPGQSASVTVNATDADAQTVTVAVTVTDSAAHVGTGQTSVVISDPLTYTATAPSGTITGGGASNVLTYTAP